MKKLVVGWWLLCLTTGYHQVRIEGWLQTMPPATEDLRGVGAQLADGRWLAIPPTLCTLLFD